MDKFAVDLDQVLNDFEYSELTDQYSAVRNPVDTSNSVNHNNITKHSINNVFHSLQEYLNTNVDVPNVNSIENSAEEIKHLDRGECQSQENIEDNVRNPNNKCNEESREKCDLIVITPLVNADNRINNNDNDVSLLEENVKEHLIEITSVQISVKEDDTENTQIECESIINTEETQSTDSIKYVEDMATKEETSSKASEDTLIQLEITESVNSELEPELADIIKNDEIDANLIIKNDAAEIIKNDEIDANLIIKNDAADILEQFTKQELVEGTTAVKEIEESNIDNENNKGDTSINKVDVVGFEAVTDIHDDEINELLAELENDEDIINEGTQADKEREEEEKGSKEELQNEITAVTILDEKTTCEEIKEIKSVTEESTPPKLSQDSDFITDIKDLPKETLVLKEFPKEPVVIEELPEETITVEKCSQETLETVREMVKTDEESINSLEKIVESSTDITDDIVNPIEVILEKDQMAAAQEIIKEAVIEKEQGIHRDDTVMKEEEQLSSKEECETKTENKNEDVKYERQDSASRPQNLPLKEDESDKPREINLIGEPGSTPYNNVYMSKEIHKQERDNESVSSISSNTFSDTGSTASTASTEEIRDENDEINLRQVQIIPTQNLERDGRELSDNATGGSNIEEETSESNIETEGETRTSGEEAVGSGSTEKQWLGKEAPLWIPDSDTTSCLHCDMKFTVLKRRHHCRACGLVLCSKCCHLRFKLEYLDAEARVCNKCHDILNKDTISSSSSDLSPDHGNSLLRRPNPNNPLEYCSTISPLQQVSDATANPLPSVMVPVGVLKRKGSNKSKSNKSVMFCDGIRPGSDLTNLDNDFNYNNTKTKKLEKPSVTAGKINRNLPLMDSETNSFIPKSENNLPPLITITKTGLLRVL